MGALPPDSTSGPAGGRLGADLAAHVEAIVHAAEREARAAEQAIAEHRRSAEEEVRRYLAAARLQVDAETAARTARIETLTRAARRLADELTDAVAALTRELQAGDQTAAARMPRPPWPAAAPAPPAPGQPAPAATPPEPVSAAPAQPIAPEQPAPPVAAPKPSWSRIEGEEAAVPPASEPEPAATSADRAGGGEDARAPVEDWGARARSRQDPPADTAGPEHEEPAATNTHGAEILVPSAARLVAIEMAVGGSSRAEVERHLRDELGVQEPEPLLDDVFGAASTAGSRLAWGEP